MIFLFRAQMQPVPMQVEAESFEAAAEAASKRLQSGLTLFEANHEEPEIVCHLLDSQMNIIDERGYALLRRPPNSTD